MDFSDIIKHFQDINVIMVKNLTDTCLHMIYYLIIIDITLTFLFVEEEGLNVFIKLMRKILVYGFFIYLIKNYSQINDWLFHGFIQLGNLATNGGIPSTHLLVSPGIMFDDIFTFVKTIVLIGGSTVGLDSIPVISIESVPTAVLIFVFFLGIGALLIGIEITISFVKFFLVSAMAIILLPFGAFNKTQDIALKGLHGLFAQGIEIMFVTIILNFYAKYKNNFFIINTPQDGVHVLDLFQNLGVMIMFILMITKIPIFVATLLSGSIANIGVASARQAQSFAVKGVTAGKSVLNSAFSNTMNSYTENSGGQSSGGTQGIEYKK